MQMTADPLAWRIERACVAALPPAERTRIGDWWAARSGGGSRRINAASAVTADALLDRSVLARIDAHYAAAGLPTIVRVTDLTCSATDWLDAEGFAGPEGATRTLMRQGGGGHRWSGAVVADHAGPCWLAARRHLAPGASDPTEMAARLSVPAGYARLEEGGAVRAIGYVALHDGIAVIEAVGTDPAARRRGHARAIVAALIGWADRHGAAHIALQVEETNAPARALYAAMGFATDLYGYHYRRRVPCPSRA
ncbi:GNAT family N-acetyltransferase [Sphingomonas endophytica]